MIDLLTILQHADSAFPSGSFAFSNGIEGLAAMNAALDRTGLQNVVTMFLRHRWATSDRIALALAHRANGDLDRVGEIDLAVEAATLAEPLRTGSKRNGNALLAAHVRLRTPARSGFAQARLATAKRMATSLSCKALSGAPAVSTEANAIAVSGYSTAAGLIAAAVRLGRIGAVEAQTALACGPGDNCQFVCASAARCRNREFHALG